MTHTATICGLVLLYLRNLGESVLVGIAKPDVRGVGDLRLLNEEVSSLADGWLQLEKERVVYELGDRLIIIVKLEKLIHKGEAELLRYKVVVDHILWLAGNILVLSGFQSYGRYAQVVCCRILTLPQLDL